MGVIKLKWARAQAGYEIRTEELKWPFEDRLEDKVFRDPLFGRGSGLDKYLRLKLAERVASTRSRPPEYCDVIAPREGPAEDYEVLLAEKDIFMELAGTSDSHEGVLSFVNRWGYLDHMPSPLIESFYRDRNRLREGLEIANRRGGHELAKMMQGYSVARLEVGYELAGKSVPDPHPRPYTLLQFCWLEMLQHFNGGVDFSRCKACGKWLPIHKHGRPKEYCNNACSQKEKRRRAKKRLSSTASPR